MGSLWNLLILFVNFSSPYDPSLNFSPPSTLPNLLVPKPPHRSSRPDNPPPSSTSTPLISCCLTPMPTRARMAGNLGALVTVEDVVGVLELGAHILGFLDDLEDLRNAALTTRRFNRAAKFYLWAAIKLPYLYADPRWADHRPFWDRFAPFLQRNTTSLRVEMPVVAPVSFGRFQWDDGRHRRAPRRARGGSSLRRASTPSSPASRRSLRGHHASGTSSFGTYPESSTWWTSSTAVSFQGAINSFYSVSRLTLCCYRPPPARGS